MEVIKTARVLTWWGVGRATFQKPWVAGNITSRVKKTFQLCVSWLVALKSHRQSLRRWRLLALPDTPGG